MSPSRAAAPLALLAVLALAPSAAACQWVVPDAFDTLQWAEGGVVATNRGFEAGAFNLGNGTFEPVGDVAHATAYALSPDGAWFVNASGTFRASRSSGFADSCDVGWALVHARDLRSGELVLVSERGATALAASADRLAVAQGATVGLAGWGDFEERARFRVASNDSLDIWGGSVHGLQFAPSGRHLAAWSSGAAVLYDAAEDRVMMREEAPTNAWSIDYAAPSPDGRRFAVAGARPEPDGNGSREAFVTVKDVATGEIVTELVRAGARVDAIAWGAGGLAVALTEGGDAPFTRIILFDGDLAGFLTARAENVGWRGLAWSPDGARLAVGGGGTLRILDAALDEEARFTLNASEAPSATQREPDRRAPFAVSDGGAVRPPPEDLKPTSALASGSTFAALAVAALVAGAWRLGARGS